MLFNVYGSKIGQSTNLAAADFSPAMVEQTRQLRQKGIDVQDKTSELWQRLNTSVIDAQVMEGVPDESISHVLSGMMYMLVPEPDKAIRATYRVLKPNGVLALSCWMNSDWMEVMRIVTDRRPDIKPIVSDEWMTLEGVRGVLERHGFKDVETVPVSTHMDFEKHELMVDFCLDKMPHILAIAKNFSKEERAEVRELMIERMKGFQPEAPGTLSGIAIVAVGRR